MTKDGRNPRTKEQPTDPPKAGERMLAWLSWAAKLIREQAGASQEEVAVAAGLKARAVDRFEQGHNWPRDLERIVAAYAEVGGLQDSIEPWNIALDLWREHGLLPLLSRREERDRDSRAKADVVKDVLEQARRTRHTTPAEPSRKSTATPKRRAAR